MVDERQNWIVLQTKWKKYEKAARDTLEVSATDAPMATMMLGGTDDDFQQLASGLQEVSLDLTQLSYRMQKLSCRNRYSRGSAQAVCHALTCVTGRLAGRAEGEMATEAPTADYTHSDR